ncbi:hypothetical protein K458DRAFT_406921 [Lentithecium fluviatile CBS 122367]|uniref:Uncharacterized protein n=1 Tax=Lentithecium fluviatile CBS 122367 TaxID=1168545 RepID=A0A6G1IRM8_9PLEO|nr:hypothetical protein K458DRAFT_406921 [Lentithecium fluviatile CBS 122367]
MASPAHYEDYITAQQIADCREQTTRVVKQCRFQRIITMRNQSWDRQRELENAQMDKFAGLSCRALCQAMLNRLPRELRDLIYRYLVLENKGPRAHVVMEPFWKQPLSCTRSDDPNFTPSRLEHNHFFNLEFVGPTFLHELGQVWYSTCNFLLLGDKSLFAHMLGPCIDSDPILAAPDKTLVLSPRELIRRVEFRLFDDDFEDPATHKALSQVSTLKNRARVTLTVKFLHVLFLAGQKGSQLRYKAVIKTALASFDPIMLLIAKIKAHAPHIVVSMTVNDCEVPTDATKFYAEAWRMLLDQKGKVGVSYF